MLLKFVTAGHILGVALFLGSILGHAVTGLAPLVQHSNETRLLARQIVDVATWYLTLPGLVLIVASGSALVLMRQRPLRLLAPHLLIAAAILANAFLVLLPTAQAILAATADPAASAGAEAELHALEGREALFGALNVLLGIAALAVGVFKPGASRERS